MSVKGIAIITTAIAISLVATLIVVARVARIEPGQIGIRIDYAGQNSIGDADVEVLSPGYHFAWPGEKIVEYPGSQQTLVMARKVEDDEVKSDNSIQCQDKSGVQINIDASTLWRIDASQAGRLFVLRPNADASVIRDQIVRRDAHNAVTVACSRYAYFDILGDKRAEFAGLASENLKVSLGRSYLILDQVIIGEIHLQPTQQEAITRVDNARQLAREAQFLQEQRENEANAAVAQAEGAKSVSILQAEGQAESIRIIQEQLSASPSYLTYLATQRWDGVLPLYMLDGGGLFSVILPAPKG